MTDLREVAGARELLANLVMRDLRSMYKRTILGWGWSLINPLAQVVIYTFVFGIVFRAAPPSGANGLDVYAVWLLCALLPWNFFAGAMNGGMQAILANANLVQKTYFPRALLVLATTASLIVTFGVEMAVLLVVLTAFGVVPVLWIPAVLVLMVLIAMFGTGFGLALSVSNVYFRDTPHLMAIFTQIWFFATPIIYPITQVEGSIASQPYGDLLLDVYGLNPMLHFANAFRAVLYYQELPGWQSIVGLTAVSVGTLVLGWLVFRRFEPRLAEEL